MTDDTTGRGDTRPTSIAEQRRITQPDEVRSRANAEHWTASLYLRDVSPYLTRPLLRAGFSANGVTWLMIISAALAAVATGWSSLAGAALVVMLWLALGAAAWRWWMA